MADDPFVWMWPPAETIQPHIIIMKVLKFGGTSVGSANSILNLKNIVESQDFPVVVVVSALGGVTDLLIKTARTASEGNEAYKDMFQAIVRRHHDMINDVITDGREDLLLETDALLAELSSIYHGV